MEGREDRRGVFETDEMLLGRKRSVLWGEIAASMWIL